MCAGVRASGRWEARRPGGVGHEGTPGSMLASGLAAIHHSLSVQCSAGETAMISRAAAGSSAPADPGRGSTCTCTCTCPPAVQSLPVKSTTARWRWWRWRRRWHGIDQHGMAARVRACAPACICGSTGQCAPMYSTHACMCLYLYLSKCSAVQVGTTHGCHAVVLRARPHGHVHASAVDSDARTHSPPSSCPFLPTMLATYSYCYCSWMSVVTSIPINAKMSLSLYIAFSETS